MHIPLFYSNCLHVKKGCDDVMDFSISQHAQSRTVIHSRVIVSGLQSQSQKSKPRGFSFSLTTFFSSLSFYSFSLISVSCALMGKEEGDFFLGRRGSQGNS